jgi:hypothetical protein
MAKSKAEWLEALKAYCDAAQRVSDLWPDGDVENYPAYLPSFDEHVNDLRDFLDTNSTDEPLAERIGAKFADILKVWFSPEQWEAMRIKNASNPENVCASHDYCNANIAMLEAFHAFNLNPRIVPDIDQDADTDDIALWDAAWKWAKANRLTAR